MPTATDEADTDQDEKASSSPPESDDNKKGESAPSAPGRTPAPVAPDNSQPWAPTPDNAQARHIDAYTKANQNVADQFGQQHPFLPSRWAPPAPPEMVQQATLESDQEQQQRAAQEKAQANQERLARNDQVGAQMRGTGQKFYTDSQGRIQPVVDPTNNKPIYNTSSEKTPGVDPSTKLPAWVTKNKYGENEYSQPKFIASPKPGDTKLYADFGDGNQVAVGEARDLINHPNFGVARPAIEAVHKQQAQQWNEALEPMRAMASQAQLRYQEATEQLQGLPDQINQLQSQSDALSKNPDFNDTMGGIMGIGGKPSDKAIGAQNQKNLIDSQITQLTAQQAELAKQVGKGGSLKTHADNAKRLLPIYEAQAKHDSYSNLAQLRAAIVKSQGGSLAEDPTLQSILAARSAFGSAVGEPGAGSNAAPQPGTGPGPNASAGQPAPADAEGKSSEPFELAQQGVKKIGATSVDQIAQKYGDGKTAPTPASLVAMYGRVKDIKDTLANKSTSLSDSARNSLQQEHDYLDALFNQRLTNAPAADQRRVSDATRDPTLLEKIGGVATGLARGAGTALTDIGESAARNALKLPTTLTPGLSKVGTVAADQAASQQKVGEFAGAMRQTASDWKASSSPEVEAKLRASAATGVIPEALGGMLPVVAGGGAVGGVAKVLGLSADAAAALTSASTIAAGGAQSGNSLRREAMQTLKPQLDAGKISQGDYERSIGLAELAGTGIGAGGMALGPMTKMATRLSGIPAGKTFMDMLLQKAARGGTKGAQKWLTGEGQSMLVKVAKEGAEQTGVGFLQNLATDIASQKTFDPNRKIDLKQEAIGAGEQGIAGTILSALTHIGNVRGKATPSPDAATSLEGMKGKGDEVAGIDRPYTDTERANGVQAAVDKLGPQPPASTAAESAQAFAPELAEKANTPPPAKSAAESADVFKTEGEKGEVDAKVGAQQEAKAQSLVDQIQEATGKPREEILATREGKSVEDWTKELTDEAKYQKSPLTVDPDRRSTELRQQIADNDKEWATHVDKTAQDAERESQIAETKRNAGEKYQMQVSDARARHDDIMSRRDAIQRELEKAENLRQSPEGAAKLKADLAAKEAAPVDKQADVIDKLKGAMLLKPEDYSGGKSSSLGLDVAFKSAHDAALHVAIAAVRAGRKIGEVIKAAVDHFRDAFPKATPEQVKTVEDTVREHVGAKNIVEMAAGKRDKNVSDGSGTPTPFESKMIDDWKNQIAEQTKPKENVRGNPEDTYGKVSQDVLNKYPEQFSSIPPKHLPVEVQRADGSKYPAAFNGYYDAEGMMASLGRKTAEGWSHGISRPDEKILTPLPTPEQWSKGVRDVSENSTGKSNANANGEIAQNDQQQHTGTASGENIRENGGQVRPTEGAKTVGSDSAKSGPEKSSQKTSEGTIPRKDEGLGRGLRLSTSDKIIKALESAKLHKPGEGLAAAASPFSLAWDGAIDTAILSIKAGRVVGDVVKLAIGRLKERHPDATDSQVQKLEDTIREHMGEVKPSPQARVLNSPEVDKARKDIANTWDQPATIGQLKEKLSATRDVAETQASRTAGETYRTLHNELTRSVGKDNVKAAADALAFKVEAGDGGQTKLDEMRKKIDSSEKASPKWKKRALAAIDYAKANFEKLQGAHDAYTAFTNYQAGQEQDAGLPTLKRKDYVPHAQDMDGFNWKSYLGIDPETRGDAWSKMTGFAPESGGTSPTGADSRKNRTFDTFADSIAAGTDPKSLNALDLLQRRVRTGQTGVNLRAWEASLKNYTDPNSGQALVTKPERVERKDGTFYFQAPDGYKNEMVGNTPIAVKEEYSGIMSALTDPSWLRKNAPTRMVLKATGFGKSASLLVDTFHLGRLALRQMITKIGSEVPLPSYSEGLSLLEHSPVELNKMAENGEIPKESLPSLLEKQKKTDLLINSGLNVGSTSDAIHQELVRKIPVLGDLNKLIFDKFSRGAMMEAANLNFDREKASHPELSDTQVARNVAKDTNLLFGNLGRQGWFKSKSSQDLARLISLAPQWNESLIKSEVGGVAQIGKSVIDAVTGRRLAMGMLGRQMVAGTVGLFVVNQIINQATRRKFTWENPEEGIGAKLSAWIPDGVGKNSSGFFLNPMSVSAEIASTLLDRYEKSGNTYDPIVQYFRNRASTTMRPLITLLTKTNFLNQKLKPTDVWKETGKAAIPAPISGSAAVDVAKGLIKGGNTEKYPGEFQKQALSTIGLKTQTAPSPEARMYGLADSFNRDHGHEKNTGGDISDYKDLSDALKRDNSDDIHDEMTALLEKKSSDAIERHFSTLSTRAFTGNKANESAFVRSLTPEQRSTYVKAQQDRARIAQKALQALDKAPLRERKADLQLSNP